MWGLNVNRENALSLLVAVVCIAALGTSAATLESALSTDPDDVIDFRWEQLPTGQEEAKNLKEEMETNKQGANGNPKQVPEPKDGEGQNQANANKQDGNSQGGGTGQGPGPGAGFPSLLDRLLALLRELLPFLLLGLGILVAAGLLYRYRHRLWALVLVPAGLMAELVPRRANPNARSAPEETSIEDFEPENDVDYAWFEMVKRLDIDSARSKTPGEYAHAARDAGMDPSAVDTITGVFQEVRYGGQSVTDERRRRARQGLRELGIDGGL